MCRGEQRSPECVLLFRHGRTLCAPTIGGKILKTQSEILNLGKLVVEQKGYDGGCGRIYLNGTKKEPAAVVWSFGGGWDHVSVSYRNRCPSWEEMCRVKEMFFYDEEVVVQYHPKKSEYKNLHNFCLHLWKKQGEEFATPPVIMV